MNDEVLWCDIKWKLFSLKEAAVEEEVKAASTKKGTIY